MITFFNLFFNFNQSLWPQLENMKSLKIKPSESNTLFFKIEDILFVLKIAEIYSICQFIRKNVLKKHNLFLKKVSKKIQRKHSFKNEKYGQQSKICVHNMLLTEVFA
jgi:hypothetical protein